MIELPYSISSASISGSGSFEGLSSDCKVIISDKTKTIPDCLFNKYKGTLVMRAEAENEVYSNVIKLPKLESIGANAFLKATGISNLTFELPNILSFGGIVGENCKEIRFGESGTPINPKFSWIDLPVEDSTKIWGASMITLYDPDLRPDDEAYNFLATYFDGTISHTN
jgi:hypothetical protein